MKKKKEPAEKNSASSFCFEVIFYGNYYFLINQKIPY